jgi:5-methylcytosine-specific restriction endonuclease McrA
MLRLQRPAEPKAQLKKATEATRKLWDVWKSGKQLRNHIRKSAYGGTLVKRLFREAQFGKCAYCEDKIVRYHAHVDHYRPKLEWSQSVGGESCQPGYFWLAYTWTNFCLICPKCNGAAHKASLFPLNDPTVRATPANTDISREEPILINPFDDDPSEHIGWRLDMPIAVGGSSRGVVTIAVYGLAKDETLIEERGEFFDIIVALLGAVKTRTLPPFEHERHLALIKRMASHRAAYSSMMQAYLRLPENSSIVDEAMRLDTDD